MKKLYLLLWVGFTFIHSAMAEPVTLQIHVNLKSFVGNPSWLLMIRDLEHNQNIPFLYDFTNKTHYWTAYSTGKNYLIVGSTLQFNKPHKKSIENFCSLESNGRIVRSKNMVIQISGTLKPNSTDLKCSVSAFKVP